MEEKSVEKILWDGITLKGIDKWSDKLRVYWFIVSFVLFGSVVDEISLWLLLLVALNFFVSAWSLRKVKFPESDEKEEV
jgi:hypothetical protein